MSRAITTVSFKCQNDIFSSRRELLQPRPCTVSLISIKPRGVLISSNSQKRHNFSVLYKLNNADSDRETENSPRRQFYDKVDSVGVEAALSVLKFYKREISPLLPKSCRYLPTCSEYSMEAYRKYGFAKGTVLTAWRICRCNPLGGSGFDPPRWFGEKAPTLEELDDDMV